MPTRACKKRKKSRRCAAATQTKLKNEGRACAGHPVAKKFQRPIVRARCRAHPRPLRQGRQRVEARLGVNRSGPVVHGRARPAVPYVDRALRGRQRRYRRAASVSDGGFDPCPLDRTMLQEGGLVPRPRWSRARARGTRLRKSLRCRPNRGRHFRHGYGHDQSHQICSRWARWSISTRRVRSGAVRSRRSADERADLGRAGHGRRGGPVDDQPRERPGLHAAMWRRRW